MSDSIKQKESIKQEASSSKSEEQLTKNIIVSIVLTESTTNLLKLDLPHLEDLNTDNSEPMVCAIKAESSIAETNYKRCNKKLAGFSRFWFATTTDSEDELNCEQVVSEVAYLRSNPSIKESLTSFESEEQEDLVDCKNLTSSPGGSSISVKDKLKPIKVYTRPLFTVRSMAHQDQMRSEANNLYISVKKSKMHVTDSGWVNVCRICHGGESIGDLLSLCHCRGSIALAHLECLERWLKESANSRCELCQHHFQIIREPKYGILKSIFVFLRHPGEHLNELLFDLFAFLVYTPAAVASTYMLVLLCESATRPDSQYSKNVSAHILTLVCIFGMAAIDFTYSSWFMVNMQKHVLAWRSWYRNHCNVRLLLPERKRRHRITANMSNVVD